MDHCIGRVFGQLKRLGMYESSLIIVTGDHGEMLGEHGELTHMYFIYQSALKVPLVFRLPGANPARTIDDLASIIDIVPTVCSLVGIEPPAEVQGESLAAHFSNAPPASEERYLYCESLYPTKYEANSLLGLAGTQWKYVQTTRPELYDLQKDPAERTNLVEREPQQARILKDHLARILEQTVCKGDGQETVHVDENVLRNLRSLGYAAGGSVRKDFSFDQSKDDPKDVIGYHNESREVCRLMEQDHAGRNQLEEARAGVERLIEQRPAFVTYDLAMDIAIRQKDYAAAVRYGESALKLKRSGSWKFYALFHMNLATAYAETRRDEAAAGQLEVILGSMEKDSTYPPAERVKVLNRLGSLLARQKKFDRALVQFKESIKLDPQQPDLLHSMAQMLLNCPDPAPRNPSEAVKMARQACRLTRSKNPMYLNTLAVAYYTTQDYRKAVSACEEALALVQAKGDHALAAKLQKQRDLFKVKASK